MLASNLFLRAFLLAKTKRLSAHNAQTMLCTAHLPGTKCKLILIMADADEESEESEEGSALNFKKPLELFEEREIVRICAPMVRYSK